MYPPLYTLLLLSINVIIAISSLSLPLYLIVDVIVMAMRVIFLLDLSPADLMQKRRQVWFMRCHLDAKDQSIAYQD